MTSRHQVPTDSASLALTIATDAARVRQAQEGFTTVAMLDVADASLARIQANVAKMRMQVRGQRKVALAAEREAATRRPTQSILQETRA